MPSAPVASLSSTLRTRGGLCPLSFIIRIISSESIASCPQPKLTIWIYSSSGVFAATIAAESIRVWKLLVISALVLDKSCSFNCLKLSTGSTDIPFLISICDIFLLTNGSVWYGLPASTTTNFLCFFASSAILTSVSLNSSLAAFACLYASSASFFVTPSSSVAYLIIWCLLSFTENQWNIGVSNLTPYLSSGVCEFLTTIG